MKGLLPQPRDARGQLIKLAPISGLLERIVSAWRPREIRLFGSRARGESTSKSDWDLLVIVSDGEPAVDDPLAGWRLQKEAGVSADVILGTVSEFEEARDTVNTLAFEAAHHGVPIYERV